MRGHKCHLNKREHFRIIEEQIIFVFFLMVRIQEENLEVVRTLVFKKIRECLEAGLRSKVIVNICIKEEKIGEFGKRGGRNEIQVSRSHRNKQLTKFIRWIEKKNYSFNQNIEKRKKIILSKSRLILIIDWNKKKIISGLNKNYLCIENRPEQEGWWVVFGWTFMMTFVVLMNLVTHGVWGCLDRGWGLDLMGSSLIWLRTWITALLMWPLWEVGCLLSRKRKKVLTQCRSKDSRMVT